MFVGSENERGGERGKNGRGGGKEREKSWGEKDREGQNGIDCFQFGERMKRTNSPIIDSDICPRFKAQLCHSKIAVVCNSGLVL